MSRAQLSVTVISSGYKPAAGLNCIYIKGYQPENELGWIGHLKLTDMSQLGDCVTTTPDHDDKALL